MPADHAANIDRFSGYAQTYDSFRPAPPRVVPELLCRIIGLARPTLVVDVGSGTGLSTRVWSDVAERAIGIEPNDDMRIQAQAATNAENVTFQTGSSTAMDLPDGCADIVTCSQALHWMEPEPTFVECARVLRPGGIFAAIDCDWPPTLGWEVEAAYNATMATVQRLEREHGIADEIRRFDKEGHLKRIQASGQFRWTKEVVVHSVEPGDAARIVGLALSQGGLATLQKRGFSDEELGVTQLRAEAQRLMGDQKIPWYFSYRVRVGVK